MTGVALDRHLSVTVNAPSGLIVGKVDDATGQIAFNVKETGESLLDKRFSISNAMNRFVFLSFFIQSWFHVVNGRHRIFHPKTKNSCCLEFVFCYIKQKRKLINQLIIYICAGFYQMCFSNFHNRFGSMQVFMHFGVYYEGQKEEEKNKKEEDMKQINNTLSFIQVINNYI